MIVLVHIMYLFKHTSRHLFHEDLDVSVLRNRAQVLNNVPVLQVLVKGNLFMKRLRVPDSQMEMETKRETLFPLHLPR